MNSRLFVALPLFSSSSSFSIRTCPHWYAVIERDLVSIFLFDSSAIDMQMYFWRGLKRFLTMDLQPLLLLHFPHFLCWCVTVITLIFEYGLKIPVSIFLIISELIPLTRFTSLLPLPVFTFLQSVVSASKPVQECVWTPPSLLPFLSTQCSTSLSFLT